VTLDNWLAAERERLEQFARYWRDNRESMPDEFPAEMPTGEWDEQYRAYTEV
jgi:hypothetical protein